MYATVLGTAGFRAGMDLYFDRHDGQAVTCDDFWQAMFDANTANAGVGALHALKAWYGQAGTPELSVSTHYDAGAQTLRLDCAQRTPLPAGAPPGATTVPVLIPIAVGILGADGRDLPLTLACGGCAPGASSALLPLTAAAGSWTFTGVPPGAVPSILRSFSAPVRLAIAGQSDAQLAFLLAHDSDPFNRWEAGQRLARAALLRLYDAGLAAVEAAGAAGGDVAAIVQASLAREGGPPAVATLAAAFAALLGDGSLDGAFTARAISLPAEAELVDALAASPAHGCAQPLVVAAARAFLVEGLARALRPQLEGAIARADAEIAAGEARSGGYSPEAPAVARRALRNKALGYLACLRGPGEAPLAELARRHAAASNMTDSIATLAALMEAPPGAAEREAALAAFADRWRQEPLVLLKWLALQAGASEPGAAEAVRALQAHPAFAISNPNACYALFGAYAAGATRAFHAADGSGYAFLAGVVLTLDAINPTVASRIASAFTKYRSLDPLRQGLIRAQLQRLAEAKLSENVGEIVARSLAA